MEHIGDEFIGSIMCNGSEDVSYGFNCALGFRVSSLRKGMAWTPSGNRMSEARLTNTAYEERNAEPEPVTDHTPGMKGCQQEEENGEDNAPRNRWQIVP